MSKIKYITLLVSIVLSGMSNAWAQSGSADPEFDGNSGAVVINGLRVITRQDLDFGVIAPSLTESGTVKVNRGRNNSSICSANMTCLEPGTRARYTVVGEPYMYVTLSDPGSIYIADTAGNQMLVDGFFGAGSGNETRWQGWILLRNSGVSRPNAGATLHVGAAQPPGTYTGSYTISFEYQ